MKKFLWIIPLTVALVMTQAATLNIRRVVNSAAPPAPTNFVVTFIVSQPTNVFLSWGNAATNYASLNIDRSVNGVAWLQITNIPGSRTAFTNLFTWTNTTAYYRISAVASNGLVSLHNNE